MGTSVRSSVPAVCRTLLFLLLLTLSGGAASLSSNTYPPPYDAKGGVAAWEALLTEQGDRYNLTVLEPFESLRQYRPYAPSTELAETRYVYQIPDDPAFTIEHRLVGAYSEIDSDSQSLLVQCSFTTPGRQHFEIRPAEPLRIYGQPFRLSLWVHSQGYPHRLEFMFRNADGRPVRVDAGSLNWKGWRRLDLTLPAELNRPGKRIAHRFGAQLEGIVIRSHPSTEPGAVALMLDHLLILTDLQMVRRPGGEIIDRW